MKKIIAISLSFFVIGTMFPIALASNSSYVLDDSTQKTAHIEEQLVIQVEPGKATFSKETNEMLDSMASNIDQVVYQVDAGKDTFTIGYAPGLSEFDVNDMKDGIQGMVDLINQDIKSDSSLDGNREFKAQELELTQLYFDATEEEQAQIKKNCAQIMESAQTAKDVLSYGMSERSSNPRATTALSITGSYHVGTDITGDHTFKWYNQETGKFTVCNDTPTSPHAGDGNARYSIAGYKWYPTMVRTWFKTEYAPGKNRTTLQYSYSPTQLAYLQKDSNEALELSVAFYNYTNASSVSNRGYSYMLQDQITWSTTQPNAYLDTSFADNSTSVDFCVGVYDATALEANTIYSWTITSKAGTKPGYPNDGRFRVMAQRSYRFTTLVGGAFNVFAEEHENILRLGLNSGQNWVPNVTGWSLGGTTQSPWNFAAATDGVRE